MEVGHAGSGIKISKDQWEAATEQSTFTAMAISLMNTLIAPDVLLRSNVKGGKSKIHKAEDNPVRHDALDPNILAAITGTYSHLP